MSSFVTPLLREILMNGLVARTAVQTARQGSVGIGYGALAGSIAFMGLVFLSIAGYGFLLESFPMPVAAGITGCVIILIAACIAMYGYYRFKKIRIVPKPKMPDSGLLSSLEDMVKPLLEGLEDPVRENPKMAVLLAALAGFAAGDRVN